MKSLQTKCFLYIRDLGFSKILLTMVHFIIAHSLNPSVIQHNVPHEEICLGFLNDITPSILILLIKIVNFLQRSSVCAHCSFSLAFRLRSHSYSIVLLNVMKSVYIWATMRRYKRDKKGSFLIHFRAHGRKMVLSCLSMKRITHQY